MLGEDMDLRSFNNACEEVEKGNYSAAYEYFGNLLDNLHSHNATNSDFVMRIQMWRSFSYALVLSSGGQFDEAIEEFSKVIHFKELSRPAIEYLIIIYINQNRYDNVLDVLTKTDQDDSALGYYRLLSLVRANKQYSIIMPEIQEFLRRYPDDYRAIAGILFEIMSVDVNVPEFLYHYTSHYALQQIVQTKIVRATRIDFLNDKLERKYLLQIADSLLKEASFLKAALLVCKKILSSSLTDNEKQELTEQLQQFNISNNEIDHDVMDCCVDDYFVFSLTSENKGHNNDLTLWGLYSNFSGCKCEINMKNFAKQISRRIDLMYYPIRVIYGKESLDIYISKLKKVLSYVDQSDLKVCKSLMLALIEFMLIATACVKKKEFEIEQEWRCLLVPRSKNFDRSIVEFDIRNQSLYPFISLKLLNMTELFGTFWVGPKNYSDTARKGLECFLSNHGINCEVLETNDKYPFRF